VSYARFFFERLAWAIFGLWLGLTLVFVIFFIVPSDPLRLIVGPQAPPEAYERAETFFGYEKSYPEQYADFFERLIRDGSPGRSLATNQDSGEIARQATPVTLSLMGAALVVWLGLAIPVGLLAAWWNKRRVGRVPLYLAIGVGPLVLGLWISYAVGYKFAWLPIGGYCDFFNPRSDADCGGAVDWAKTLVLPGLALAIFFAAIYARVIARVARVPGEELGKRKALVVARMLGRDFGSAVGAAALVEAVFGIPGLGQIVLYGSGGFDAAVMEAAIIYALVLGIAWHFLVDLIVGALDSELRAEWPVAAVTGRA
jgi:peptide/nickel transport system permease protein